MEDPEFLEILERYKSIIFKICNAFCRNSCNRKDLEQEIVYQIFRSLKNYQGSAKLSTWIYRVALNTAISFSREEKKHRKNKVELNEMMIAHAESPYDTEIHQKIEKLFHLINELDELNRAVVILYLDRLKYKEIAAILGITETNVATKINRVKKILKKRFTDNT